MQHCVNERLKGFLVTLHLRGHADRDAKNLISGTGKGQGLVNQAHVVESRRA